MSEPQASDPMARAEPQASDPMARAEPQASDLMAQCGVRLVDVDGVRLAYREAGTGDPPIVLVHGMACDHTHLLPQLQHLAPRHRVVALDQRGHGASDRPEGEYTTERFAEDLGGVLDRLGLERPVLVGHSLGGGVVLHLAVERPDLVRAVVLLDSGVRRTTARREELQPFYDTLGGPDHADLVREFVRARLFEETDGEDVFEAVASVMAATPARIFLAMGAGVVTYDSWRAALACRVPALLIMAARPFVDLGALSELPPVWQYGWAVGAGHFLQMVVPDQVNSMLDRFLELLPPDRSWVASPTDGQSA
jgi:pimeloyl-ACP methyl ester carboxylesterase